MNKENVTKLITFLEALPAEQFDMGRWLSGHNSCEDPHECRCAGCIGGWAEYLIDKALPGRRTTANEDTRVMEWLGLNEDEFDEQWMTITHPPEYHITSLYPRTRCIAVLKHWRDTGEVDWDQHPV